MPAELLTSLVSDWLLKIKSGKVELKSYHLLSEVTYKDLSHLNTDTLKKTFWINFYNAWFQQLKTNKVPKDQVFTKAPFHFKDFTLTLDEMEHGILRKLKPHPSRQLQQYIYSKTVQHLAIDNEDYRIHFALNCGAKSCPPIRFYSSKSLHKELDFATESYLLQECNYDADKNTVRLNELFKWYLNDFGNHTGLLKILERFNIVPPNINPQIIFTAYDASFSSNDFE